MTVLTSHPDTFEQPQDDEIVLSVKNVSKRFCRDLKQSLFYGVQDIAGEVFGDRRKNVELRKGEFWALNDVSFQLRRGEALGLVGANGAGKTTLLKIISGLIKPDNGSVEIKGRVAPLIALGAGFNPILTGRENIYVNMSILGLSKKEIDERFDQVLEFAEIGEAIDAPVQSYSSGMAARLGFASAIHTEPDILLIDEVLAVGDIRFRAKCHRRLFELRQRGVSFILVSHQTQSILNVCNSAIYLSKGNILMSGDVESVLSQYENDLFITVQISESKIYLPESEKSNQWGIKIKALFFRDENEEIATHPETGKAFDLCLILKAHKNISDIGITLDIQGINQIDQSCLVLSSFNDKQVFSLTPGEWEVRMQMPCFCLKAGSYSVKAYIRQNSINTIDFVENFKFNVSSKDSIGRSSFYQPRSWKIFEAE
jgi:lipopolysaccharide transport system ATP-binding protein